jgi:hypothetical protein
VRTGMTAEQIKDRFPAESVNCIVVAYSDAAWMLHLR